MTPLEFPAPWSRSLRRNTWIAIAFLTALSAVAYAMIGGDLRSYLIALPAALIVFALLLSVRGYLLSDTELIIKRFGWNTRLSLANLRTVEGDAEAISNSKPLLAYGGLFSHVGFYWHPKWKLLRVRATDPSRAVVLTFAKRRFVVTPHDPQRFIVRVRTLLRAR